MKQALDQYKGGCGIYGGNEGKNLMTEFDFDLSADMKRQIVDEILASIKKYHKFNDKANTMDEKVALIKKLIKTDKKITSNKQMHSTICKAAADAINKIVGPNATAIDTTGDYRDICAQVSEYIMSAIGTVSREMVEVNNYFKALIKRQNTFMELLKVQQDNLQKELASLSSDVDIDKRRKIEDLIAKMDLVLDVLNNTNEKITTLTHTTLTPAEEEATELLKSGDTDAYLAQMYQNAKNDETTRDIVKILQGKRSLGVDAGKVYDALQKVKMTVAEYKALTNSEDFKDALAAIALHVNELPSTEQEELKAALATLSASFDNHDQIANILDRSKKGGDVETLEKKVQRLEKLDAATAKDDTLKRLIKRSLDKSMLRVKRTARIFSESVDVAAREGRLNDTKHFDEFVDSLTTLKDIDLETLINRLSSQNITVSDRDDIKLNITNKLDNVITRLQSVIDTTKLPSNDAANGFLSALKALENQIINLSKSKSGRGEDDGQEAISETPIDQNEYGVDGSDDGKCTGMHEDGVYDINGSDDSFDTTEATSFADIADMFTKAIGLSRFRANLTTNVDEFMEFAKNQTEINKLVMGNLIDQAKTMVLNYSKITLSDGEQKATVAHVQSLSTAFIQIYRAAESLDILMRTYQGAVIRNPEKLRSMMTMLDSPTNVVAKWYSNATVSKYNELVGKLSNNMDQATLTSAKDLSAQLLDRIATFNNLVSVFYFLGREFGNKEIEDLKIMAPGQIKKAIQNYLIVSSFIPNMTLNPADPSKDTTNGKYMIRRFSDIIVGQDIIKHKGEITTDTLSKQVPAYMAEQFRHADKLVVMMLKNMVSRIFFTIGVYDMFDRPWIAQATSQIRTMIGGQDIPEVRQEAVEFYVRLPLYIKFYKAIFDFDNIDSDTIKQCVKQFTIIPEMPNKFGGLISLVFLSDTPVEQPYGQSDTAIIVKECNEIYKSYSSYGDKAVYMAVKDLVHEVNRRYGLLTVQDGDNKLTQSYKNLKDKLRRERGVVLGQPQGDYSKRPNEDELIGKIQLVPGEDLDLNNSSVPSDSIVGRTITGNTLLPDLGALAAQFNLDDSLCALYSLRSRIDARLKWTSPADYRLNKESNSFSRIVDNIKSKLSRETDNSRKFGVLVDSLSSLTKIDEGGSDAQIVFVESILSNLLALGVIVSTVDALLTAISKLTKDKDCTKNVYFMLLKLHSLMFEVKPGSSVALNGNNYRTYVRSTLSSIEMELPKFQTIISSTSYDQLQKVINDIKYLLVNQFDSVNTIDTTSGRSTGISKSLIEQANDAIKSLPSLSDFLPELTGYGANRTTNVDLPSPLGSLVLFSIENPSVPTTRPKNTVTRNSYVINDADKSADGRFKFSLNPIQLFNTILYNYLSSMFDSGSNKIYYESISMLVNGEFNKNINEKSGLPDNQNNLSDNVDDNTAITRSLAIVLNFIINSRNPRTEAKVYLYNDLIDVPKYIQDKMRGKLPSFIRLLDICDGYTRYTLEFYNKFVNDSTDKPKGLNRLNSVLSGVRDLKQSALNTLRQLGDTKSIYMDLYPGFLENYRITTKRETIVAPPSFLLLASGIVSNGGKVLDVSPFNTSQILPMVGNTDDNYVYGTRSFLGYENTPVQLSNFPWYDKVFDRYNMSSSSYGKISKDNAQKLIQSLVSSSKILEDSAIDDYLSAIKDRASCPSLRDYNADLSGNILNKDMTDTKFFSMIGNLILPGNSGNIKQYLDKYIRNTYDKDAIMEYYNVAIKSDIGIASKVPVINNANYTKNDMDALINANIVDLDIPPINPNAMMREIPVATLLNHVYSFDRFIEVFFNEMITKIDNSIKGKTSATTATTNLKAFKDLLIEPFDYILNDATSKTKLRDLVRPIADIFGSSGFWVEGPLGGTITNYMDMPLIGYLYYITQLDRTVRLHLYRELFASRKLVVDSHPLVDKRRTETYEFE